MRGVTEAAESWSTEKKRCERRGEGVDDRDGTEGCSPEPIVDDRGSATEGTCEEIEPPAAPPNA